MTDLVAEDRSTKTVSRQQFIKRHDSRYCLPKDIEVIRVLAAWQVPNNDGGTGWHYEYDVLYEEVAE